MSEPQSEVAAGPRVCRILLVEDDDTDLDIMLRMLRGRARPVAVQSARSLARARAALEGSTFDIILFDNALPDGNACDFAGELCRAGVTRRTRVYIVSDWPSPLMWEKARQAGVRAVIPKRRFCASLIL